MGSGFKYRFVATVYDIRIHDGGFISTLMDIHKKENTSDSRSNMIGDSKTYFQLKVFGRLVLKRTFFAIFGWLGERY